MPDEKLEQEMKALTAKLRDRDEAERKKAVKEFRAAMGKDTAGTVLSLFNGMQAQVSLLGEIQNATNPLAPLLGRILNLEARVAAIETALTRGKGTEGEE